MIQVGNAGIYGSTISLIIDHVIWIVPVYNFSMLNSSDTVWEVPPARQVIDSRQVQIWRARLDGVENEDEQLWKLLSGLERDRADRFRFDQHRFRFLRSHGILRAILSRYCGIPAAELPIETADGGKPFIGDRAGSLRFNLSHSGDWMALGITAGHELGVDIEIASREVDWQVIAKDYFHPREMQAIAGIADLNQRVEVFFRVWTLKEAYLKAAGRGLAGGLERVEVEVHQDRFPAFVTLPGDEIETRRWQVLPFQPVSGVFGAAVVERLAQDLALTCYHWQGLAGSIT
jgi:4'-phosphopantetheinyl transferase